MEAATAANLDTNAVVPELTSEKQQLSARGFENFHVLTGGDEIWQNWFGKVRTAIFDFWRKCENLWRCVQWNYDEAKSEGNKRDNAHKNMEPSRILDGTQRPAPGTRVSAQKAKASLFQQEVARGSVEGDKELRSQGTPLIGHTMDGNHITFGGHVLTTQASSQTPLSVKPSRMLEPSVSKVKKISSMRCLDPKL